MTIICASERTAARLLDMKTTEFRKLVNFGALPLPKRVGGMDRWRVADLEAIVSGNAAMPSEDFEL